MSGNFRIIKNWRKWMCGRVGELFDMEEVIRTPTVLPTSKLMEYMTEASIKIVNNNQLIQNKLSVVSIGIDKEKLKMNRKDLTDYVGTIVKKTKTPKKMIHFILKKDIRAKDFTTEETIKFLELQRELGLFRATIPNSTKFPAEALARKIKASYEWKNKAKSEIEIMGVGCTPDDIDILAINHEKLDCFGVILNYQQSCKPILNKIMIRLKTLKPCKYIHAFSTPLAFKDSYPDYSCSFGPMISVYGVDGFSGFDRVFNTHDFSPNIKKMRIFLPDYSTKKIEDLDLDQEIGSNITVADLIEDEEKAYKNIKAFNFMAMKRESEIINSFSEEEQWIKYIKSKPKLQALFGGGATVF